MSTGSPPDVDGPVPSRGAAARTYELLDGMRGIAALAVAVHHMPRVFGGVVVPNAYLAVDFFLQLSGFVIAHAYFSRIRDGMPFSDFAYRRINRLYPTYLLGLLAGLAVATAALLFGETDTPVAWTPAGLVCSAIPNLVMLPAGFCGVGTSLFPFNAPMWSIFYELVINFAIFFLVGFLLQARWLIVGGLVAAGALIALTLPRGTLDVGFYWETAAAGLVRMTLSFLIGVALYRLRGRTFLHSDAAAIALLVVLAAVLFLPVDAYLYELLVVMIAFPAIVFLGSRVAPIRPAIARACFLLGVVSYPLYVLHKPLAQLLYAPFARFAPEVVDALGAGLGVAMLGAIGILSLVVGLRYEPRARALMDAVARRSKPHATP